VTGGDQPVSDRDIQLDLGTGGDRRSFVVDECV
jgi:hypothetical protein